jgi:hypothetical protein
MPRFTSPNARITGPLPRRDILAICAFLNRSSGRTVPVSQVAGARDDSFDRLIAASRMQ